MQYSSVAEMAKKWQLSERSVRNYCAQGRVQGAELHGRVWSIPETAVKPERVNKNKQSERSLLNVLQEEKASRVKELLDTVQYLYRDIRGRRENLSPLFIIGGRYKRKNPFFENIVSVKANKIGVATLKEIVEDSEELKEYTYTGITSGIFDNEKDVKEKLKAESVGNVFKHLKEEVDAYYEGN